MNGSVLFLLGLLSVCCVIVPAANAAAATEPKIGFVLSTLQEERYIKDQKYFVNEAHKLGFKPVVVSADNNPQTQTAKVENLLSEGVKALVIQPVNSNAATNLVRMAHDDNVPVIAYDRVISNAPIDYYITENAFKIGVLQAEAAVKATHGKGNYVLVLGQAGHNIATEITRGYHSVLSKYPDIHIVVEKNHENWSPSLALATVENALARYNNNIQAVLCNNSGMANAAVQALNEQKLAGKVFVAGADADVAAIKNIVAGKQQVDVMQDIEKMARDSADIAYKLALKQKIALNQAKTVEFKNGRFEVPMDTIPVYLIDKGNIDQRIIKSGFHTRAEIYGH